MGAVCVKFHFQDVCEFIGCLHDHFLTPLRIGDKGMILFWAKLDFKSEMDRTLEYDTSTYLILKRKETQKF